MAKNKNQAKENKDNEESLKKQLADVKKLIKEKLNEGALTQKQVERYREINRLYEEGNRSLDDWKQHLHDIDNSLDEVSGDLEGIAKAFDRNLEELTKTNVALNAQKAAFRKIGGVARELAEIRRGETEYSDKELKNYGKKISEQKKSLEFQKRIAKEEGDKKLEEKLAIQLGQIGEVEDKYKEILKVNKDINNSLGFTPKILGGIDKSLQKLGFGSLGIDDAVTKTKQMGQAANAAGEPFSALGTFTKEIGKNIKDSFSATKMFEVAIAAVVIAGKKLDKLTGDIAAHIGISYEESSKLTESWNELAINSESAFITTKSLGETFNTLNKGLSNSTNFSDELLTDFTELSKQADISNEALAQLSKLTVATGGNLKDNTAEFQGQVVLLNELNNTSMSEKQVLEEITKISAATTLTLGMQPKELAKAVYQAKALGLEMAQVESIASGLLDFESSIQNELQAELLIGRDINLEKARQYALEGDIGKVAEEVANQIGTAADFTKMNVIQQEALAKSVGMTRNDLAKSLTEREMLAKLGGKDKSQLEAYNRLKKEGLSDDAIAKKFGVDKIDQQLKSESIQARFTAALEKAQEVFVDIAADLSPLMSQLSNGAMWLGKWAARSKEVLYTVTGIWAAFKGWKVLMTSINALSKTYLAIQEGISFLRKKDQAIEKSSWLMSKGKLVVEKVRLVTEKAGLGVKKAANFLSQKSLMKSIGTAIMSAISSLSKIPFIGFALGLAAGATITGLAMKYMSDGVIGPGGKTIVSGPEGSIQLNDKDSMVVGTDLGGEKKQSKKEIIQETSITSKEQLQEAIKQNTLLTQLMESNAILVENTQKLKDLDNVGFYEVQ